MSGITQKDKEAVVVPEKDIVAAEVQNLRTELIDLINSKADRIIIDLSKVEMIDSSGIGVFISTQNSLKKINGSLKVIGISPDILKMFKIMRLDKHFEVSGRE